MEFKYMYFLISDLLFPKLINNSEEENEGKKTNRKCWLLFYEHTKQDVIVPKKKFEDINGVIESGKRKTNNDQHYTETKD